MKFYQFYWEEFIYQNEDECIISVKQTATIDMFGKLLSSGNVW